MSYKKLWIALGLVLTISFAVLGGVGFKVLKNAPPIPSQVVTTDGHVLFDGATIQDGQNAWQSIGGQEVGTIWGHGSYVAPDWTADWLHRECIFILDRWAQATGAANYAALGIEQQAALRARLQEMIRHNTYDPATGPHHRRSRPRRRPSTNWTRTTPMSSATAATDYAIQRDALSDPAKAARR